MSTITSINDYSYLFESLSSSSSDSGSSDILGIDYAEYASIKNGSYSKLAKAYYASKEEESSSAQDSTETSTLIQSSAAELKQSAEALTDASLWEKTTVTETDEETGETTQKEDYDWEAITEAVQSFVDSYNEALEQAASSNTTKVLRNGAWMTQSVAANENLLAAVGITIGEDNTLSVDAEQLKEADISTLKTLFYDNGSLAEKISRWALAIANAAAGATSLYTSSGSYSAELASLSASVIDEEV